VLVTPGGGGDGYRLVDTYLKALPLMTAAHPATPPVVSLIIGGPEMATSEQEAVQHRINQRPDTHWLEFTDDLASYMAAADVVVSMGGYNTVGEILTLQRRALVVPRVQPVAEQWMRARRLAELGLLTVIHPDELTPSGLAQALQRELHPPTPTPPSTYALDLNALPRITETLLSLVNSPIKAELVA
jgi:predicted glycosyltransferase